MFATNLHEIKQRRYLLRWRFDFAGRPSKYGHWGRPETVQSDMAAHQMKEGLVRAAIEAKDIFTREVTILAQCDGWDYNVFKWMAIARAPALFKGSFTPFSQLVGLTLVTRNFEFKVYDTGEVQSIPRSAEDQGYHYATFGR